MTIQTIPTTTRRTRLAANAGQTVFTVPWPFFGVSDLAVRRDRAGTRTVLTYGADYTVAGAGEQAGGSITLTSPAIAGDTLIITSNQPIQRTTDFSDGGDLPAQSLDDEYNRLIIALQQVNDRAGLAIAADPGDAPVSTLPPAATRANRLLGFDSAGNPVPVGSAVDQSQGTAAYGNARNYGLTGSISQDATLGMNQFLAAQGGYAPPGFYTITGDLNLPAGAVLRGFDMSYGEDRAIGQYRRGTVLLLTPSARIVLRDGAALRNVAILNASLPYPPTNGTDAAARIAAFAGTAIDIAGADTVVDNVLIIGFDKAYRCIGYERPNIRDLRFDCTNGVEISQCFDVARADGIHGWQYYIAHNPALGTAWSLTQRAGIAFDLHDVADGTKLSRIFSYGFRKGVRLKNVFAVSIDQGGADNAISEANGNIGLQTEGTCNGVLLSNFYTSSNAINFDFAHTAGHVVASSLLSGIAQNNQVRLGASSSGSIGSLAIGGTSGDSPVLVASGVGNWNIGSVAAYFGTPGFPLFSFANQADIAKINLGMSTITDTGTSNNMRSRLQSLTIHNNGYLGFRDANGSEPKLVMQADNLLALISTDPAGAARTVWSIQARSAGPYVIAQPTRMTALPTYANDAAAGSGGLIAGDLYYDGTGFVRRKL